MDEETEREETVPFAAVLQQLRKGGCHHELSEGLAELVQAVEAEGKAGTLTLTLKVSPFERGVGALKVVDAIKIAAPKPENPSTMFFADDEGNLSRMNRRQPELPGLSPVEDPPAPKTKTAPNAQEG